jgi:hypothetical protein
MGFSQASIFVLTACAMLFLVVVIKKNRNLEPDVVVSVS